MKRDSSSTSFCDQVRDNVVNIYMGRALTAASAASHADSALPIFFRQVFEFAIDPVALSRRRLGAEIVPARDHGEVRQHAAIPGPRAVAGHHIQIQVVGNVEAVAGGAYQVAGAAGEAASHVLFPDRALPFARDDLGMISEPRPEASGRTAAIGRRTAASFAAAGPCRMASSRVLAVSFFPSSVLTSTRTSPARERSDENIGAFGVVAEIRPPRKTRVRIAGSRTGIADDGRVFAARQVVGIGNAVLKEEIHQEDPLEVAGPHAGQYAKGGVQRSASPRFCRPHSS